MLAFSITWAQGDSLAWEASIIQLRLWSHSKHRQKANWQLRRRRLLASPKSLFSDFARNCIYLRYELKAGSSAIGLLWSTFDQSNLRIRSDPIRSNPIKRPNMAGDCRYPLTLLKRVKRSREISQQYGKDQNRSTDLPFSSSAEAILASQQGYFLNSNRFDSICFHMFKGAVIPLLSL